MKPIYVYVLAENNDARPVIYATHTFNDFTRKLFSCSIIGLSFIHSDDEFVFMAYDHLHEFTQIFSDQVKKNRDVFYKFKRSSEFITFRMTWNWNLNDVFTRCPWLVERMKIYS